MTSVPSSLPPGEEPAAPHLYPDRDTPPIDPAFIPARAAKRWYPKRVLITKQAAVYPLARRVAERAAAHGAEIVESASNRLPPLRAATPAETYRAAKSTLAIVVSPPSQRKLAPIPPSADWQFHLARGCPAHCSYCYLAGSLDGPPITRAYANLEEILDGLRGYLGAGAVTSASEARAAEGTTFEASCYTDPLALEHLTGAVGDAVAFFGAWEADVQLRWTTKFDDVDALTKIAHHGRTRARFSVNARDITRRFEAGTAALDDRIAALAKLAGAGFPVGLTVAPIMPIPEWRTAYRELFALVRERIAHLRDVDLTIELITHRFTPGSKDVLTSWYPASALEMDESRRTQKRTKFGSIKYVYPRETMRELQSAFTAMISEELPAAKTLYWT